jgi:hypothetical protein
MGASQSIKDSDSSSFVRNPLRNLILCLATVAVAATIAGPAILRAQQEIRIPQHAYMPPDFPASVSAAIPTPRYLPAGYELWRIYRDPPDGFRTGKSEVEVQYRDPGCWGRKTTCPLQVFVSPITEKPFSGTAGHTPERLSLRIGKKTVEAQYFAGMGAESLQDDITFSAEPEARLEASVFNALVFPFDGFMIGIRANSQAGVGRAELIRVTKSLTYTVR